MVERFTSAEAFDVPMEVKTMNDIPLDEWKILDVFYQVTYLSVKQV